jgi:protein-tyrosine-phosphatase
MVLFAILFLVLILVAGACSRPSGENPEMTRRAPKEEKMHDDVPLYPELAASVAASKTEFDQIPEDRKARLREIASFVSSKLASGESAQLTFICTHNSRRSHMSQIWAQTAAHYFGYQGVETFSGGTETTAFNPRAVAALERVGFQIEAISESSNPIYQIRFHNGAEPMVAFSKVYDQPPNPKKGFCAVMTCSQADRACPLVLGAERRVAIPYEDPKIADGTEGEADAYDDRCRQIAREMLYLFSRVDVQVE